MKNITLSSRFFKPGQVPLALVRHHQEDTVHLHQHQFHELVVILKGEGVHATDTETYPIGIGDVFLVRPGTAHGYKNTSNLDLVNILYVPDRLYVPDHDLSNTPGYHAFFELEPALRKKHKFKSRLTVSLNTLEKLQQLAADMEQELGKPRAGAGYMACAYFMQIKGILARSYSEKKNPLATELLRIGSLLSFMERSYAEDLTLSQLAKQANMSKSTLNRVFHKTMHMPPINYLISIRIARARTLLEQADARVTDVAFEVGFSDSNYFSRMFKLMTGISPLEYKKNNRI